MSFRFYIVSTEGEVVGTDSEVAAEAAKEDNAIIAVVDVTTNRDLVYSETLAITQQIDYPEDLE